MKKLNNFHNQNLGKHQNFNLKTKESVLHAMPLLQLEQLNTYSISTITMISQFKRLLTVILKIQLAKVEIPTKFLITLIKMV